MWMKAPRKRLSGQVGSSLYVCIMIFIIYLFIYWPFPNYTPTHIIIDCECFITSLRANHRWHDRHDPCPLQHVATSFCCRESLQCGTPNHKLSYLRIYTLFKNWEMSNNGIEISMHCMEFGRPVRYLQTNPYEFFLHMTYENHVVFAKQRRQCLLFRCGILFWANDNNSLTWNVGPFWDDPPY